MNATVKFSWNQSAVNRLESNIWRGCIAMGYGIAAKARQRIGAAVVTGNMKASVRVEERTPGEHLEVVAGGANGGANVPYALRRNFENKKHPSSQHYMENGLQDVLSGSWQQQFFGGITQ